MTIITNDPAIDPVNTDSTRLERRADTFISWWSIFPEPISHPNVSRTFYDEKAVFLSMLPLLYSRYLGEYVAIAKGQIVDHDRSRLQLVRRFFANHTATPVYIGLVGPRDIVRIPTPFVRRRS